MTGVAMASKARKTAKSVTNETPPTITYQRNCARISERTWVGGTARSSASVDGAPPSNSFAKSIVDLTNDSGHVVRHPPSRIVALIFGDVAYPPDVVSDPGLLDITPVEAPARCRLSQRYGL